MTELKVLDYRVEYDPEFMSYRHDLVVQRFGEDSSIQTCLYSNTPQDPEILKVLMKDNADYLAREKALDEMAALGQEMGLY